MANYPIAPDLSGIAEDSSLYRLYSSLYSNMQTANQYTPPVIDPSDETLQNSDGELDDGLVRDKLNEYSLLLMQNSAFNMATAMVNSLGGSSGGGGEGSVGFVSINGDSMLGMLKALYGFQAGYNGQLIFQTIVNNNGNKVAHVLGYLSVDETLSAKNIEVSESIWFGNKEVLYIKDAKLTVDYLSTLFNGDVSLDAEHKFSIDKLILNKDGIKLDDKVFYYAGNSNISTVDWTMNNANVYGDLSVTKQSTLSGFLSALGGFKFSNNNKDLLYSVLDEETQYQYVQLDSCLHLGLESGVKFNNRYIIQPHKAETSYISINAPGMELRIGGSDGDVLTGKVTLQSNLCDYTGTYSMVTYDGGGNFPKSFNAGYGNVDIIETYSNSNLDYGMLLSGRFRFVDLEGPYIDAEKTKLIVTIPNGTALPEMSLTYVNTTSLFRDLSITDSISLSIDTDGEFVVFEKPVEVTSISIKSEVYKTRLIENALFFGDATFIEGVTDGLRLTGNVYFSNNLSSSRFSSGFAGNGWAIMHDALYGNYAATFDELTIRKKMRVFELEVQKLSVTNGALWVSDSCSGDLVEEI